MNEKERKQNKLDKEELKMRKLMKKIRKVFNKLFTDKWTISLFKVNSKIYSI